MAFPPLPPSTHPSLLGRPTPPRPAQFTPHGAPVGSAFSVDLGAFTDNAGMPWYLTRPKIVPQIAVVHTNGASVQASLQSQVNWGNSGKYERTHQHWAVNEGRAVRLVPSDRRGIGNSTPKAAEDAAGVVDCSFWSTVIETRDTGYLDDPGISDFLPGDAELVATILAYESLIDGQQFPIQIPLVWTGEGVVTHTWPHDRVYTTVSGKICPGTKKKATFRDVIVPRAAQIRAAWLADEEDDMYSDADRARDDATAANVKKIKADVAVTLKIARDEVSRGSNRYGWMIGERNRFLGLANLIIKLARESAAAIGVNQSKLDEIDAELDDLSTHLGNADDTS